jgi:2-dehydro-3-deoxy-D-arabinonate dehydratase
MRLFRCRHSIVVEHASGWLALPSASWDDVFNRDDLRGWLESSIADMTPLSGPPPRDEVIAPIGSQEVWAAGVTYFRSRTARMEESKSAGGGDFYDRVYMADRPELFFKATPHRVRGSGEQVRLRRDARWNVPEPELALAVTSGGRIVGYTIGNDMSSRDIEGENPLYLPQAKVYDGSCGLGPAIYLPEAPLSPETTIRIVIRRGRATAFDGETTLAAMKRKPEELVEYLFRDNSFPTGCFLLTGTGIVPPDAFTLAAGDEIAISIAGIGTLVNTVSAD